MINTLKRSIILLLSACIVAGCGPIGLDSGSRAPEPLPPEKTSQETENEVLAVTTSRLNLRAENSSKSGILSVLSKGETVKVVGTEKGWLKVETGSGKKGWVAERYTRSTIQATPTDSRSPGVVKEPVAEKIKPSKHPPAAQPTSAAEKASVKTPQIGSFSQKDAVELYNYYRKSLADGDLTAFAACVYGPPAEADAEPSMKEATPEQFNQLKDFLLELSPDLEKSQILRFYGDKEAALLVIRSDRENKEYITLSTIKFIFSDNGWKVFPKFYDTGFPRGNQEEAQAAINEALEDNPDLQLSAVMSEVLAAAAPVKKTPLPGEVPDAPGKAEGELIINGTSYSLPYAYAYQEPGLFDKTRMDTVVILSNMELDAEAVENWGRRADLEKEGALHCVELTINSDGAIISRRLRDSAFEASPSGVSTEETFIPQETENSKIAGRVFTKREEDFFGVTFQYRAAFHAKIRPHEAQEEMEPKQSDLFKDNPEHKAIVKLLEDEGKDEILKTASSISMSTQGDFARVFISYSDGEQQTKADFYLFRENGEWTAYSQLPTHKDRPEVFSELAMKYCQSRYEKMMGISFMDDSYKNKDSEKRVININCAELIDNKWNDHLLSISYKYDDQKGWMISESAPYRTPEKKVQKKSEKKPERKPKKVKTTKKQPASLQEAMKMSDLQIAIMLSTNQGESRALELIGSGSDLKHRSSTGDTALHTAVNARPPSTMIVKALLEAGAEVDAANEYGYTPLHNLAQSATDDSAPVAKLLINAGADVNRKDPYGMTPLYHMTIHGLGCKGLAVARLLISAGADVSLKTGDGTSVLSAARKSNCDDLAALLEKEGAH